MALYRVDETEGSLSEIPETSLSGEGMQERGDLQHWLRDRADVLERGLFVLADGYRNWEDSNREIDILALDQDGRLVVVELKRDEGAFMDLQAIRYAAMVAHMTFRQAVDAHRHYLARRGTEEDAEQRVLEHVGADEGGEPEISSAYPRILLAARDFPQELTASVLWLNNAGLDIRCVRLLPYRVGGDLLLDVTQVIPLPEAEDYMVRIRDREAEQEHRSYPDIPWSREDIEHLAARVTNSLMLRLYDLCAAAPGGWVSLGEVRALGSAEEQARWPKARFANGSLAGLRRMIRREFGRDNSPTDFEYRQGLDTRSFRLPADVAEWWRAAREPSIAAESPDS